jgi:hypothetical protein
MQFDRVEPAHPSDLGACAACRRPLVESYYLAGPQKICSACRDQIRNHLTGGAEGPRVAKAIIFGLLIAVVGGAAWASITIKTEGGYRGFLAIILGYLVGIGVRKGSEGRGGRGYQVLAVLLTYLSLVVGYSGVMFHARAKDPSKFSASGPKTVELKPVESETLAAPPAPRPTAGGCIVGVLFLLGICVASPVVDVIHNPLLILLLGIALWEGWRMNRGTVIELKGPFHLGNSPSAEMKPGG